MTFGRPLNHVEGLFKPKEGGNTAFPSLYGTGIIFKGGVVKC
jgi:hypothetical protein